LRIHAVFISSTTPQKPHLLSILEVTVLECNNNVMFSSKQQRCTMKSYGELKAYMKTIQQKMDKIEKRELTDVFKKVKEFDCEAGMLKGELAEGRNKK
jgi:hypothetical protein